MSIINDMGIGIINGLKPADKQLLVNIVNEADLNNDSIRTNLISTLNTKFNTTLDSSTWIDVINKINSMNLGDALPEDVIKDKVFTNNNGINQKGKATIESIIEKDPTQLDKLELHEKLVSLNTTDESTLINKNGDSIIISDYSPTTGEPIIYLNNGYCILYNTILTLTNIYKLRNSNIFKYDLSGNLIYTKYIGFDLYNDDYGNSLGTCGFGYYDGSIIFATKKRVQYGDDIVSIYKTNDDSLSEAELIYSFTIYNLNKIWVTSDGSIVGTGHYEDYQDIIHPQIGLGNLSSISFSDINSSQQTTSYFIGEDNNGNPLFSTYGTNNGRVTIELYRNRSMIYKKYASNHVDGDGPNTSHICCVYNNFAYFYYELNLIQLIKYDILSDTEKYFNTSMTSNNKNKIVINPVNKNIILNDTIYKFQKTI